MAPDQSIGEAVRNAAESRRDETTKAAEAATHTAPEISDAGERAAAEVAQGTAEALRATTDSAIMLASEVTRSSLHQAAEMLGAAADPNGEAARHSAENVHAVVQVGAVLASGYRDLSREMINLSSEQMRRNLDGLDVLLRTRTPQELVAAQSDLLRQNVEEFLSCGQRLSEITMRITREAVERCHRPA